MRACLIIRQSTVCPVSSSGPGRSAIWHLLGRGRAPARCAGKHTREKERERERETERQRETDTPREREKEGEREREKGVQTFTYPQMRKYMQTYTDRVLFKHTQTVVILSLSQTHTHTHTLTHAV